MAVKIQPRFDFESRKPKLPEVVRVTTRRDTRTRNQWICPFCNSGSTPGEGHDGALTIYTDTWRFYCFSCHAKGDVYDYIRLYYGITDIKEQAEKIDSLTGFLPVEVNLTKSKPKRLKEPKDFTSYLLECEKALSGSPGIEYLHQRGLSDEIIQRFHLGYDSKYKGITIPYPETRYYLLRYLHPVRDKYYKPRGEKEPLFFIGDRAGGEWMVMESQVDALSLHQAGATSVCAFGGGGYKKLDDLPNIEKALIVSDADEPGRKTAREVQEYLQKMGAVTEIVEPPQPFKDGNEILSKDPELLMELVKDWRVKLSQMGKAVTITKVESDFCLEESRPGKPKPSIGNFVAILENDQTLKNSIALNELSMLPEIVKPMPWTRYQRTISDDDLAQLRSRCEEYGISNKDNLTAAVSIVANRHAFHPLRQLLESLEWDGEDRISDLFPRYLGAARSKYTETVTRIFLHGAIERAYFPGAKLDNVLVLTGGQGIGKSSLCRFLALEDVFFTDDIPTLEGKQAIESIQGRWICELGENTAMLNARNIETIKSFVSRQTDICRLAYERYVRTMNRTAVFVITSNRTDPLPPDRSGHRRFLPLRCGDSPEVHPMDDIDATKDYCHQVMAQALHEWRNGEKMLLVPKEMVVEVEEERNDFTPEDTTAGLVRDYLNGCDEDRICTLQLFYEALKYDAERDHPQKWQLRELSEIMNSMPGWRRVNSTHRFPDYGIQKYWQRIRTADSFGDAVGDVPFL